MIRKLVNHVLRREEINGGERCPTYLFRWTLASTPWGKLYLHHFVGDDWSLDLHDHPKRFVSIGLAGSYVEESRGYEFDDKRTFRAYRAPWIRTFPAHHRHRLSMPGGGSCWTLVWVGRTEREWGFWRGDEWTSWRQYVDHAPDEVLSCR